MSRRMLPLGGTRSGTVRWPTLLLVLPAAACLAGSAAAVWSAHQALAAGSQGSVAVLLVVVAAAQLRVVLTLWRRGWQPSCTATRKLVTVGAADATASTVDAGKSSRLTVGFSLKVLIARLPDSSPFWQWLLVGSTGCYAFALVIGPRPDVAYLFAAAVALWYTLLILPLAAKQETLQHLRNLTQRRAPRRIGRLVYLVAIFLVVAELSLRACWTLRDHASPVFAGLTAIDSQARAATDEPGLFHVRLLGNSTALGSMSQGGFLNRLESLIPGSVIQSLPGASTLSAGSRQFVGEVASQPCDLVLMCVSVGDDLAVTERPGGAFDWRQLALAQLIAPPRPAEQTSLDSQSDLESFARSCQRQLTACRTPIDPAMQKQWKRVFASLDELVWACRQRQIAVALVVVPAEFQVNRALCDMLRRRLGYGPQDLDLELPQRRLATFAESRGVPLVDLLPHLRLCESLPYRRYANSWNDEGNIAAARAISGWLQGRYGGLISATAQK